MVASRPVVTRIYQNHSIDSTRWAEFSAREGDIVVASGYKAGTTWVQMIVLQLLSRANTLPSIDTCSPWLDSPMLPLDDVLGTLNAQPGRRVIKTHLPLDSLPFYDGVRYVVICRDARDVAMSLWNHYQKLVRYPFARDAVRRGRVGGPLPRCPRDVREFWRDWMTRGWFAWEHEGYPFWGNLRHTRTWWAWKHLANILFVHYDDLLANLAGEVRRIAAHLRVRVTAADAERVAAVCTFDNMHANVDVLVPMARATFRGGGRSFIFSGALEGIPHA
jgi:aryl sulfotransferase